MSDFVDAVAVDAVQPGTMHKVEIEGHEFLVSRLGDDFYITDDRCAHMHGDLSRGTLEGSVVTCPRHGSQYDVRDGHVIRWTDWGDTLKAVGSLIRHPRPIRAYEVEVADGMVRVGPEKPAVPPSSDV